MICEGGEVRRRRLDLPQPIALFVRTVSYPIGQLGKRFPSLAVSSYQRAVVWTQPQQAALIRSLLEDYPTGLIVLNKIAPPKQGRNVKGPRILEERVEIIDGQQRLTTIFEFMQNPVVYFSTWAARLPHKIEEPGPIKVVREQFESLSRELRMGKAQYVGPKTSKAALLAKIASDGDAELKRLLEGQQVSDPRFHQLANSLLKLHTLVSRRKVVIDELDGLDTTDAEKIYDVINSSGTKLRWWELLWGRQEFVHTSYPSAAPYRTTRDEDVRRVANFYRMKNIPRSSPIKAVPPESLSLWHAMYALGHHTYNRFSMRDPKTHFQLTNDAATKPKVDGLGFRLVSTFLSHDISRAAIYDLLKEYPVDQIRQAIDILYDTADVVFDPAAAGDFQFFVKYAYFYYDALPAYPLLGLFVATSKFVAQNKASGLGIKLTSKDTIALRALTEELFRDSICTSNWAGTGDTRLEQWLDSHFEPVSSLEAKGGAKFPGAIMKIPERAQTSLWKTYISQLKETDKRMPDRRVAAFHFWVQYILDSGQEGALPRGNAQYDHIVPFNKHYPLTTHPLNIAAISADLNRSKGNLTYAGWKPGDEEDRRYRQQVLCQPRVPQLPPAAAADFLTKANFTDLQQMVDDRRSVFEFALTRYLPSWISEGDSPPKRA